MVYLTSIVHWSSLPACELSLVNCLTWLGGNESTATKAKPKIKIHPLEDRVVILPWDEAESMRGGLYIPDTTEGEADPG